MKHLEHLVVGVAICLFLGSSAAPVEAQGVAASFDQLGVLVKPGDKITVLENTGATVEGRLWQLSREKLTLTTAAGPRELGPLDVAEIRQRRADSLKNGAIIGASAATGYFLTMLALLHDLDGGEILVGPTIIGGVIFTGMGAAAGAGVDALIRRKQVIYRTGSREARFSLSPLAGHGRRGVAVTLKF